MNYSFLVALTVIAILVGPVLIWKAHQEAVSRKRTKEAEAVTHDYTRLCWGHAFSVEAVIKNGQTIKAFGWGCGHHCRGYVAGEGEHCSIRAGDYLLLPNKTASTRYQVTQIEYERDPRDMWHATLKFSPRKDIG